MERRKALHARQVVSALLKQCIGMIAAEFNDSERANPILAVHAE